jgi:excisionase family DNA binding protein
MNTASRLPLLLTVKQAAEVLGQCEKTIRRRIEDGDIPVHRPGGRAIRIAEADLLAYIARTRR